MAAAISQQSTKQKGPWIYKAKVKSGTRATRNVESEYCNLPHLKGALVERHARENETLNIYGIQRVMKSHLRTVREDI
jgi:hypothetical protein